MHAAWSKAVSDVEYFWSKVRSPTMPLHGPDKLFSGIVRVLSYLSTQNLLVLSTQVTQIVVRRAGYPGNDRDFRASRDELGED